MNKRLGLIAGLLATLIAIDALAYSMRSAYVDFHCRERGYNYGVATWTFAGRCVRDKN